MPKKNLKVDDTLFNAKLVKLARKFGVDEKNFIREQAGFLAREIARYTPPYASYPKGASLKMGTAQDFKTGKIAIENDLWAICQPRKAKTINWAIREFKGRPIYYKNERIAPGVLQSIGELARWHKKNKGSRGRTRTLPDNDKPFVKTTVFNKYKKFLFSEVGSSKAAFAKAALALGSKGKVPLPIQKNLSSASGGGQLRKRNKGYVGLVRGRAKGLYHVRGSILKEIKRNRLIKAHKRLGFITRKLVREANRS
jgi:hypothetical protein